MKQYIDELATTFSSVSSSKELKELITGLFTPQEIEQLVLRLEIIKRLKKGESQRKIATDLGVGIATVTRGSRELKLGRFKTV